jgi:hypothetical protein
VDCIDYANLTTARYSTLTDDEYEAMVGLCPGIFDLVCEHGAVYVAGAEHANVTT